MVDNVHFEEDEDERYENEHHEDDNDDRQIVASGDVRTLEKDSKSLNLISKHSSLINHRVIHRVAHLNLVNRPNVSLLYEVSFGRTTK